LRPIVLLSKVSRSNFLFIQLRLFNLSRSVFVYDIICQHLTDRDHHSCRHMFCFNSYIFFFSFIAA
jgi:hypothetical protein